MGLMTLISKKINPDKNQQRLRAPPYERNVSSRSPVRIVRTVSAEDDGAPAPVVRIYRDESHHKQTAAKTSSRQNGKFYEHDHTKVNPPSGSSLRGSTLSLFKLDRPGPAAQRTRTSRNNASISASYRVGSINTDGEHKGYIDILDAQSEFSPANFHGRIKASGIRDYGEDVADRNIGVNGHDLDSKPVQEFYASAPRPPSRNADLCRPFSSPRESLHRADEDSISRFVVKEASLDSTRWSQQLDSSHDFMLGRYQPITSPASPSRSRSSKRNSLSALQSSNLASSFNAFQHAERQVRRHSFRQGIAYDSGRSTELGALEVPGLLSAWDSSSSEADGEDEALPQIRVSNQPILSPQPTSFRLSAAMASPTFASPSRRSSRRNSMQSTKAPPSLDASHSSVPDLSSLPHHLKERTRHFKENWPRDVMTEDRESAPSPSIKTSRPDSFNRDFDYCRTGGDRSTPPLSRQSRGHVPVRSSSIRHGSISSTTPTMSSSSSAVFTRPLSNHTTNTSVDLSSIALSSILGSSISLANIGNDGLPIKSEAEGSGNQQDNSSMIMPPEFSIDTDVSDDNDSFVGLQRHRSRGEEDLLFSTGYGASGQQLPGLDDMFSAPAPVVMLRNPRLSVFTSCEDMQHVYNTAPAVEKEYEQAISNDIFSSAGRSPRRRSPVRNPGARRFSASSSDLLSNSRKNRSHTIYHGLHLASNVGDETIEEEKVEKLDVISAVRLRKENKSRKRASLRSAASDSRARVLFRPVASDSDHDTGLRDGEADLDKSEKSTDSTPSVTVMEEADISGVLDLFPDLPPSIDEARVQADKQ